MPETSPRTCRLLPLLCGPLNAHDGAVSGFDINPHLPGVFVTGGQDKLVKIWNLTETDGRNLSMVASRDLGIVSDSV